jgi:hypothetical protein
MHQTLKNTSKQLPLQNFLINRYFIATFLVANMLATVTADYNFNISTNKMKVMPYKRKQSVR